MILPIMQVVLNNKPIFYSLPSNILFIYTSKHVFYLYYVKGCYKIEQKVVFINNYIPKFLVFVKQVTLFLVKLEVLVDLVKYLKM